MHIIFESILNAFECPVCLKCGSYFVRNNYFCTACGFDFIQNFTKMRQHIYDDTLAVNSFLCWEKFESDSCSELVYLLKTRSSQCAWCWYVNIFDSEICDLIRPEKNSVLIAVPGSKKSFHTTYFTNEIQRLTGCETLFAIQKKPNAKPQKQNNANDRSLIEFEINEEFTERLLSADWIYLIDDIVTTGSTLINIHKTIQTFLLINGKTTVNISALTLFYRT